MDDATVQRLNALNREFYAATADRFEELRRGSWPGWKPLIPLLKPGMSVLDVGCGNGRFGTFIARQIGASFRYHGVDSNPSFLESARALLSEYPAGITATLGLPDVVAHPLD